MLAMQKLSSDKKHRSRSAKRGLCKKKKTWISNSTSGKAFKNFFSRVWGSYELFRVRYCIIIFSILFFIIQTKLFKKALSKLFEKSSHVSGSQKEAKIQSTKQFYIVMIKSSFCTDKNKTFYIGLFFSFFQERSYLETIILQKNFILYIIIKTNFHNMLNLWVLRLDRWDLFVPLSL